MDPANDSLPYPSINLFEILLLFLKVSLFFRCIVKLIDMVNLNNKYRYECAVNIEDLVKLSDVMIEHSLGPNGGKSIPFLLF